VRFARRYVQYLVERLTKPEERVVDRRVALVGLVLASVMTMAACSDDTPTKGTAKRDDVIADANAVCRQDLVTTKATLDAYKARFGATTPSEADARDFLINTVSPADDATVAGFHAIPNPEKDAQQWNDALDAIDKANHDFKYQIDQDPVALVVAVGKTDPNKTGDATGTLFVNFGAKDCSTL
jgi:hypothetical protein